MSTLYIRLPTRMAAGRAADHAQMGCAFALATDAGSVEREGVAQLSELAASVAGAQRLVLILAAADVSLLRVMVPPLSPARLRAALPNLVEDQLLSDPADSVVAAGRTIDGLRTVAVVQRDWLELLVNIMLALGARKIQALPAQLCLPYRSGVVSAAVSAIQTGVERDTSLTLRLAEEEGIGLPLLPQAVSAMEQETLHMLQLVAPEAAVTLYVPAGEVQAYQAALKGAGEQRITIEADSWAHWVTGARNAQPDLALGLGAAAGPSVDWRRWRWPLVLGSAVLLVNILALNLDWWRLKQEANATRAALTRIFQEAYPQETVIIDPVLQMRQKLAATKRQAGQPAPDDFASLAAGFAEAWNRAGSEGQPLPAIAALEYHERALLVRIKAGEIPLAQLQPALAARNLTLTQQGADALQIRSAQ